MKTFRIIDLFAGCGGLTQGFVASGRFEPIAAVEEDVQAAATYAQNFGDHVHVGDIADWVTGSLPRADVVIGGPPCQGFSALGKRDPGDPRNSMWRHYVAALRRVRPAFFVLENVPQFLRSDEYKQLEAETVPGGDLANYALEPHILNAANFGAAQSRRRAVVVGRLKQMDPLGAPAETDHKILKEAFPDWLQTRVDRIDLPDRLIDFRGVRIPGTFDAQDIHVTRLPTDISLARYRAIPPGGSRRDLPEDLLTPCWRKHRSGAGDVMGRLVWSKPSVTIRTEFFKPEKGRYLHPTEDRPITHAEAAFIQGFPETFVWCGNKTSIARQIGNAVPVPLGESVADLLSPRLG